MHTLWRLDYSWPRWIFLFESSFHFWDSQLFSAFLVRTFSTVLYIPIFQPFPLYSCLLNCESQLILLMSCDGASGSGFCFARCRTIGVAYGWILIHHLGITSFCTRGRRIYYMLQSNENSTDSRERRPQQINSDVRIIQTRPANTIFFFKKKK